MSNHAYVISEKWFKLLFKYLSYICMLGIYQTLSV